MQRTLTIIGFILLFAIGIAALAGGLPAGGGSYQIPSEPVLTAVLVGAVVAVIILTLAAGVGLAQAFGLLSKQLNTPLDPEDRPALEKRVVTLVDRFGHWLGGLLRRVGYGESEPVKPYTPGYSYQAVGEAEEARQFSLAVGLVILLMLVYAAVTHGPRWIEQIQRLDVTQWAVALGSIIVIIGGIGAVGVGLSIWFVRTHEEQTKAKQLAEPAWPAAQLAELEMRIKTAPQTIKQMTFLDLSLIGLNLGLAAVMLGGIVFWVAPSMITVFEVDRQLNPPPTQAAAVAGPALSAVPEDVQAGFDELPAGDAARGETIFNAGLPEQGAPACSACHDVSTGVTVIGPSQQGIAGRAGTRRPGYGAEIYLYESIIHPNAFITPGFTEGLMPETFKDALSPQDIADLIAYLMTLN